MKKITIIIALAFFAIAAPITQTGCQSHVACVMKCWKAWYDVGSLTRASIADIDLRALSPSRPSTYWRKDTCCAR